MNSDEGAGILERRLAFEVLLDVQTHPYTTETDVMFRWKEGLDRTSDCTRTKGVRVRELEAFGLMEWATSPDGRQGLILTEEGRAVAKSSRRILRALESARRKRAGNGTMEDVNAFH